MSKQLIISLSGKQQVGKDCIADRLISEYNFVKMSFAYNLKKMCKSVFNLSEFDVNSTEGKNKVFDPIRTLTKKEFNGILRWMQRTHSVESAEEIINQLKEQLIKNIYFTTPRHILQIVGTNIIREICDTYHLDVLEQQMMKDRESDIVITDARFENERELIQKHGGMIVLVKRPKLLIEDSHMSENSLGKDKDYDKVINNTSTIKFLHKKVDKFIGDITNDGNKNTTSS